MALVVKMTKQSLEGKHVHSQTECTYTVVVEEDGQKCLQIDTYGSSARKLKGKKSQSIRFSASALIQLRGILDREGL